MRAAIGVFMLCAAWNPGLQLLEVRAEVLEASEYEVKAEFLARLPKVTKWSGAAKGAMTVGIVGEDPFGGALDSMMKVKHSRRVEDLKTCQIIFIPKSEHGSVSGILASLAGTGILTVGEGDGFAKQGGVIGFRMIGGKLRFDVNTAAARREGLQISPQFLKFALEIITS